MVSCVYLVLGGLKLGIVTVFIPEPALSGFTTGASIIIITSNIKYFLGISPPAASGVIGSWVEIIKLLPELNWTALCMGVGAFVTLWLLQAVNRHPGVKARLPMPIPEQLVVLVVTTAIAQAFDLESRNSMQVVGDIPAGLYTPRVPTITADLVQKLIEPAIIVSVVTYILTINVAKAVGTKCDLSV